MRELLWDIFERPFELKDGERLGWTGVLGLATLPLLALSFCVPFLWASAAAVIVAWRTGARTVRRIAQIARRALWMG